MRGRWLAGCCLILLNSVCIFLEWKAQPSPPVCCKRSWERSDQGERQRFFSHLAYDRRPSGLRWSRCSRSARPGWCCDWSSESSGAGMRRSSFSECALAALVLVLDGEPVQARSSFSGSYLGERPSGLEALVFMSSWRRGRLASSSRSLIHSGACLCALSASAVISSSLCIYKRSHSSFLNSSNS